MIKEEVTNKLKKRKLTHLVKNKHSVENTPGENINNWEATWQDMKGNSRFSLPCVMMVSRIEKKTNLEFHLYFCLSKKLSLWTEYKLYPLPILLEKLDDVKKIYALVILYATYEK